MSRWGVIIVVILFMGCDTSDSVVPRNADFFVKIIGTEGNQYGNDVIQAADGGFVIVGKTEASDGAIAEFLVLKTDSIGNTQWIYPALPGSGIEGEAVSVVEYNGSFIVGGTNGIGSARRSVIVTVDENGNVGTLLTIQTNEPGVEYFNSLSKLTIGASQELLVSGETNHPTPSSTVVSLNGYLRRFSPSNLDSIPFSGGDYFNYFGGSVSEDHVTGAFETTYGDANKYIVLGYSNIAAVGGLVGEFNFYYALFDQFGNINASPGTAGGIAPIEYSGNQSANGVTEHNSAYHIIGSTGSPSQIIVAVVDNGVVNDRPPSSPTPILSNQASFGKAIALQNDGSKLMTADQGFVDQTDEINRTTNIGLLHVTVSNIPDWSRNFGVAGQNFANTVIVDRTGSIVTVGTIDLESQKKVVLIKTGSNGEMSF